MREQPARRCARFLRSEKPASVARGAAVTKKCGGHALFSEDSGIRRAVQLLCSVSEILTVHKPESC